MASKTQIPGVYLLKSEHNNVTVLKIGYSKNIKRRLSQHKTSNPMIEFIGYIETEDYKLLEKDLHKKCMKYYFELEWFFYKDIIVKAFSEYPTYSTDLK